MRRLRPHNIKKAIEQSTFRTWKDMGFPNGRHGSLNRQFLGNLKKALRIKKK